MFGAFTTSQRNDDARLVCVDGTTSRLGEGQTLQCTLLQSGKSDNRNGFFVYA